MYNYQFLYTPQLSLQSMRLDLFRSKIHENTIMCPSIWPANQEVAAPFSMSSSSFPSERVRNLMRIRRGTELEKLCFEFR